MKKVLLTILSILMMVSLASCTSNEKNGMLSTASEIKPYQYVFNAFDTQCYISLYGVANENDAKEYCQDMRNLVTAYEMVFSKTLEGSEIYEINHRETDSVMVSDEVANIFEIARDLKKWSFEKFDISLGTLIDLWDIKNRTTIPPLAEINEARKHCNNFAYTVERNVVENARKRNRITFTGDKETQYDLGGLIKGYCCDALKAMLEENDDIKACIVNLGGNVLCTGEVDGRKNGAFKVGIFKPFSGNEIIDTVEVKNRNVITSGNYQRYFKVDGDDTIYHHIIDPDTGYPSQTGLDSVTIVSENGLLGDYLSTACMMMGEEMSEALIKFASKNFNDKNIQAIFVYSDGRIVKYPKKVNIK